jgi:hypothetical protein
MLVWRSVVGLEAVADPGIELGMESQVDPEVVEFVESVQSVDLVPDSDRDPEPDHVHTNPLDPLQLDSASQAYPQPKVEDAYPPTSNHPTASRVQGLDVVGMAPERPWGSKLRLALHVPPYVPPLRHVRRDLDSV